MKTRLTFSGFRCEITQDDGTWFATIYDPRNERPLRWHHFDDEQEAVDFLRDVTARLKHAREQEDA